MPQILTTSSKVSTALSFFQGIARTSPSPENVFIAIGRQTVWPDEGVPPTPVDSVQNIQLVKSQIIALKKISSSNLAFIVPRYNWVFGQIYDQYSATDASLFTKQFYVLTSENNVYKCLNNNTNQPSIVPPAGTSTSPILTGDGYTWKFMFNLSSTMVSNFLLTNWLPVPFGFQKTAFHTAVENSASYSVGSPQGGHGYSAVHELGANRILLSQKFDQDELGALPVDTEFREISFLSNPRLLSTGLLASGTIYNTLDSNNDIDLTSGELLFVDNRQVINRAPDQSETIRLIIKF